MAENDEKSLNIEQKKKIEKQVKKYMKSVKEWLKSKGNGEVRPEWALSLSMLESYYTDFLTLEAEIRNLDSLVEDSHYGKRPNMLLAARDKCCVRLESLQKSLGLTFKEQAKMDLIVPVAEESVLETFVKKKMEGK